MKKQDKLLSLLKRHGWERKKAPEGTAGIYYRFRQVDREKEAAYNDGFEALGWCEALDVYIVRLWVQKEGDIYAAYLEF